jgi:CBS domain-containing protein/sporulation protein YlmC with PRC-barrel domain
MIYLSQILNKKIAYQNDMFGKVTDLVVSENTQNPIIDQLVIKQHKQEYLIPAHAARYENSQWILSAPNPHKQTADEKRFYLAEDLLDKQVIDINGKRLVRVNDILLSQQEGLKIEGIDIGVSGVLRRLGINLANMRTITLPWSLIEAFDYDTGNIQLKLTQSKLNTFHPAELADILEEAGTKERLGLVKALNDKNAAYAISEADEDTQSAILEQVPQQRLKNIVEQMRSSSLADVFDKLNPFTTKEILESLGTDKAKKLKKLLTFEDDVAGGLMDISFIKANGTDTVGEMLERFAQDQVWPETMVLVDENDKIIGTAPVRGLVNRSKETPIIEFMKRKNFVYEDTSFSQILKLFAEYNLRLLPVVDNEKKVIGVISVDAVLAKIQEEEEKEDYAL